MKAGYYLMESYYLRVLRWGDIRGEEFWRITDAEAYRIDVISASGLTRFPREPDENIKATLDKIMLGGEWYELSNKPGQYFPRMARPNSINERSPGHNPGITDELRYYRARSTGQLHTFVETLDQIGRVVHPETKNLQTYGHATRNILILACTEVEAHWRSILGANGYTGKHGESRFDTTDYVKLLAAMRLDQYVINLNYYPWLPPVTPFADWTESSPTKSIPWYHAYNQVKHDREGHFAEATLERALVAVTACFVMLCAQYGWDFALQGSEADQAFFKLLDAPEWSPSEIYVPPFEESYEPQHYPFTAFA